MMRVLLLAAVLAFSGCTYFFTKVIPMGEPVTKERCEALDMHKIGYKDGEEGQNRGDKYDFWRNDCLSLHVTPDRAAYDRGYDEGLKSYCSCELGFKNAIHGEILGLKAQYFVCSKAQYAEYSRAFDLAQPFLKDETLVKYVSVSKTDYFDEAIAARAKTECAKPIPAVKPTPAATPKPTPEPKSPRPFDPDKKKDDGA